MAWVSRGSGATDLAILGLIAGQDMNTTTEMMMIYPDTAKAMLETNSANRSVRQKWVDQLADIIKSGEFVSTHQGIGFDVNGRLIDGQHRLLACIKANAPITIQVTKGLPASAWYALDQGINRNYSDVLEIDRKVADIIGRAHKFYIGGKAKPVELVAIRDSIIGKTAAELQLISSASTKTFSSGSVRLGATLTICMGLDKDYVFSQYKALVSSDFDEMSEITKQFYKQGISGQINPVNLHDTLAKALVMFDAKNAAISRFSASSTQQKMTSAKKFMDSLFSHLL
jgi:hypothetical protein